jgi:hypothetical protein
MDFLYDIGFSKQDIMLIILCPLSSMIGGLVHFLVLETDFSKMPGRAFLGQKEDVLGRVKWIIGRLIISSVLGLVIGLYFVGALVEGPTIVARIIAFSIFVGYAAHKVWVSSDKVIAKIIEDKIKETLKK